MSLVHDLRLATAPAEARPPTERAASRPELGSPTSQETHHAGAATSRLQSRDQARERERGRQSLLTGFGFGPC